MNAKATKARKKRESDFRDRLSRDLKDAGKGRVDASLVERAKAVSPAFVADVSEWTRFSPSGYPVTNMGVIASANILDARFLSSPGAVGLGTMGVEALREGENDHGIPFVSFA